MTNVAAGWYPDPAGGPQQRWWDGTSWSQTTQPTPGENPYVPMQPYGAVQPYDPNQQYYAANQLRAPEGTNPTTPQAWIFALAPLLSFIDLGVSAATGAFDTDYLMATSTTFTPANLFTYGFSTVVWLVMVFVANADYRELQNRMVPRPFHWAWAFIPIVYVIGRAVIVYSRTSRGLAPLFVWIGALVLTWIVSFTFGIVLSMSMLNDLG